MTLLFTCPHCGTQTDAYEEYAGQTGPCAVCGRLVTVPWPTNVPAPEVRPLPQPAGPGGTLARWLVIGGIVAAIACGAISFVGLLLAVVFPAINTARQHALRSQSAANLKAIVTAMQAYEAEFNSLPPAYIADAAGKPQHSWRVLLLPYLGYQHIYDRYDFNQPWDSPANMILLGSMPTEYAAPADSDALAKSETSYMVLVGPRTLFPGATGRPNSEVTDGLSHSLLLVETPSCGVCWLEPKDLAFASMQFQINGAQGVEIGSCLTGGAHVAFGDGEVRFLPNETPPEDLRAMSTIDGNELIPSLMGQ